MLLKVASYNIRKAVGLDWRRKPQRVLDVQARSAQGVAAFTLHRREAR